MKNSTDRLTESKEDYLETILMLSKDGNPARLVDIAKRHSVSKATVSNALAELGLKGYISYEKYRPVFLTKKGRALAGKTLDKHRLLIKFLAENLGVEAREAAEAACKIEHAIGANIASKLAVFMERISAGSDSASGGAGRILKKTATRAGGAGKKR